VEGNLFNPSPFSRGRLGGGLVFRLSIPKGKPLYPTLTLPFKRGGNLLHPFPFARERLGGG
tara:strand:- start:471 stop:653 length:183 start_codon:yes stop_codon:yes gene_type:complete